MCAREWQMQELFLFDFLFSEMFFLSFVEGVNVEV
jgi:hypothetical protein